MKIRLKLLLVLAAIAIAVATPLVTVLLRGGEARSRWLLGGFLLAALLLTGLAYGFVGRWFSTVDEMSEAGMLESELPYDEDDELGRLAASVNRMRRSLVAKIDELEQERHLLASVLRDMKEGLLLVGADRRIHLANEAFRQIFGLGFDPAGRLLAEVIRDPTVMRDLDAALAEAREVQDLVLHAADTGRSFELHVTPVEGRGALILFFDVTRLEALESVRREFVANVSHELRTPLTSIKAFVETLLEGGLEDRENSVKFLEIVRKHSDRMGALIDDLTDLSLIETGAVTLELNPLDASDVAREVAAQLSHRHGAAGVEVRVELPSPFHLRADRRRLEQVLLNLIDNGIKFNRPGGAVRITGGIPDGRPTLVVEDTGVGIPADSLERVFNRFYRVDKARSREVGGTGLGLAIVKHLMRLHGGQVRVESELGRGSRFILEFPATAPNG